KTLLNPYKESNMKRVLISASTTAIRAARTRTGQMLLATFLALITAKIGYAKKPSPPTVPLPNPHAKEDMAEVRNRGDIRHLPEPLKDRLVELAGRPHSQLPTQAYAEAHSDKPPFKPKPSELFQYYLLDTNNFEPNPFTKLFAG